jgi:HAD superfamily hydrolase (TIGR01509 family)
MMEQKKQPVKMVIFDLDGVILNSEPLHEAAKKWLLEQHGVTDQPDLSWSIGRPGVELWTKLIQKYNLQATPQEFERRQYEFILDSVKKNNIPESKGLRGLLDWLHANQIVIGLASSSDRFYVDQILNYYHLTEFFKFVTSGDEVPQKKPAPDVYLRELALSGMKAENVVAIEDSAAGSLAAEAAGIQCIGYLNPTSGEQDLSHANCSVQSLTEIPNILFSLCSR